ncbi:MAG: fumarate hydratase C-terminal domain-containing protein, partial [Dehalococcoidia bacterium]|nr:fumarate hydratase C-terminal domain-containing protein [Dehalococcoidia bacterium]
MLKKITSPLDDKTIEDLRSGEQVLISGIIYVGRDTAHKRITAALESGEKLPFDIRNQTIYYMGPSPAKPGQVIGAAGPTTSGRMDSYSPRLIAEGLRVMIGKGQRSPEVK